MGLFNHLFGNLPSVAREVRFDSQKRLQLWLEHLANYSERERLSSSFSFRNVDAALQDFDGLIQVLGSIERLIGSDIIDIEGEEKTESEILADLKRLVGHSSDYEQLHDSILEEDSTQKVLLAIFQRIHDVLKAELHAIKLIRQKPGNVRELLLLLFQLVFQREAILYKRFSPASFRDKLLADKVGRIANAILLEQEFKEEVNADENAFVRRMVTGMGNAESRNRFRVLAESIHDELLERTGAPWRTANEFERGFKEFQGLIGSDGALAEIIAGVIRKRHLRYRQEDIPVILKAFRQSYDRGHFDDLGSEFYT